MHEKNLEYLDYQQPLLWFLQKKPFDSHHHYASPKQKFAEHFVNSKLQYLATTVIHYSEKGYCPRRGECACLAWSLRRNHSSLVAAL